VDVGLVRARVSNTVLLNNITIPAASSAAEGEDGYGRMSVMPGNPKVVTKQDTVDAVVDSVVIGPRWTGLDYAVSGPIVDLVSDRVWESDTDESMKPEETGESNMQLLSLDEFFSGLGRKKRTR